jgi:hypothetical protein
MPSEIPDLRDGGSYAGGARTSVEAGASGGLGGGLAASLPTIGGWISKASGVIQGAISVWNFVHPGPSPASQASVDALQASSDACCTAEGEALGALTAAVGGLHNTDLTSVDASLAGIEDTLTSFTSLSDSIFQIRQWSEATGLASWQWWWEDPRFLVQIRGADPTASGIEYTAMFLRGIGDPNEGESYQDWLDRTTGLTWTVGADGVLTVNVSAVGSGGFQNLVARLMFPWPAWAGLMAGGAPWQRDFAKYYKWEIEPGVFWSVLGFLKDGFSTGGFESGGFSTPPVAVE